jgi:hypothetical protein
MKIPKYWAKATQTSDKADGKEVSFTCWQWSDESVEDARRKASTRASAIVSKLANDIPLDRYGYADRPLREETLETLTNGAGDLIGVVTRNSYGAQILNATKAMFIDIDFPRSTGGGGSLLGRFFGKKAPTPEEEAVQRVTAWHATRTEFSMRVYRTAGGLRCLITSHLFDPKSAEALNILQALQSDPLYVRLCKAQECYRARLTPKPWRVGLAPAPARGNPPDEWSSEQRYREWIAHYQQAAQGYTTCRLLTQLGSSAIHSEVRPILNLHDRLACGASQLPLA